MLKERSYTDFTFWLGADFWLQPEILEQRWVSQSPQSSVSICLLNIMVISCFMFLFLESDRGSEPKPPPRQLTVYFKKSAGKTSAGLDDGF